MDEAIGRSNKEALWLKREWGQPGQRLPHRVARLLYDTREKTISACFLALTGQLDQRRESVRACVPDRHVVITIRDSGSCPTVPALHDFC